MNYLKNTHHAWKGDQYMKQHDYTCGYCNRHTSSNKGLSLYENQGSSSQVANYGVYVCTYCKMPTFLWDGIQIPGSKYGNSVMGLSDRLSGLYEEARDSFSVNAYTAVILICRKLLMHIAVDLGAEPGKRFIEYVNYLKDNNFVTTRSDKWVDSIRKSGNESNHEVNIGTREEAELMIKFSEMIIKTNFEYPALMEKTEE